MGQDFCPVCMQFNAWHKRCQAAAKLAERQMSALDDEHLFRLAVELHLL
jgi:hypothetical protein